MAKTLYSLMLSEDVVREVDRRAHALGVTRSGLINQVLAEYVNYKTPEQRINDVFSAMEQLFTPTRDIVPFFTPNAPTISLKSSLQYKYRPTVRYEVQLYKERGDTLGELDVVFRTQSRELISALIEFFRLWKSVEGRYLISGAAPEYTLYDGRLTRTIALPADRDYTNDELAGAISGYIKTFDAAMKGFLSGWGREETEALCADYVRSGGVII